MKNYGDMTKYKEWKDVGQFDVLVGGTPCQSFSVAGLRKGLDDPRGNLMLTFGAIADYFKPTWIVWENVPGVLSSNGGRDFGSFLGMLGKLGYGFAYRVLDAQYLEWHKDAAVCSLSDTLETGDVPRKYYLTPSLVRVSSAEPRNAGRNCRKNAMLEALAQGCIGEITPRLKINGRRLAVGAV